MRNGHFVPFAGIDLEDYLYERYGRVVGKNNGVQFAQLHLQLSQDQHRYYYVKAKANVLKHMDGTISIYHGPRRLERYTAGGELIRPDKENRQVA